MILDQLQNAIARRQLQRDNLSDRLGVLHEKVESLKQDQEDLTKALEIIQVTAKLTQQELEIHISELATLALEAVFPRPYKLILKFELRRNRSEADLLLVDEDGNTMNPIDAVGGGVVDVVSLALRLALWSLKRPRPMAVMIMDEPLRYLSTDLQERAGIMIKELSEKLGMQFLIITHEDSLLDSADRVFHVVNKKGVSKVEVKHDGN